MFLRNQHLESMHLFFGGSKHPQMVSRLMLWLAPCIFLIVMVILFRQKYYITHQRYTVYPTPHYYVSNFLLGFGIIAYAAMGLYSVIKDSWPMKTWVLYLLIAAVVGLYLVIYQIAEKVTIFISFLIMGGIAVGFQFLFIYLKKDVKDETAKLAMRNIASFLFAIAVILACHHLGQVMCFMIEQTRRCHAVFFWITTLALLVFLFIFNNKNHGPIKDLIGYLVGAVIMLTGMAIQTQKQYDRDLNNLF